MKLSSLIAAAFGIPGFVVSVLAGLFADNSIESILIKALACTVLCYVVGYFVGLIGQQVSVEHALRMAMQVSEKDKAEEQQQLEAAAARESEAAERAGETPATPQVATGKN